MENSTLEKILALCDEIEGLLRDAMPMADSGRLQQIEFACAKLCGHDSYISQKANQLSDRAAAYLSAKKHQKHPGGADGLMHEMRYSLLGAIREQANFLTKGLS